MLFSVEQVSLRRITDIADSRMPQDLSVTGIKGNEISTLITGENQLTRSG